jgi:hypothetical protein
MPLGQVKQVKLPITPFLSTTPVSCCWSSASARCGNGTNCPPASSFFARCACRFRRGEGDVALRPSPDRRRSSAAGASHEQPRSDQNRSASQPANTDAPLGVGDGSAHRRAGNLTSSATGKGNYTRDTKSGRSRRRYRWDRNGSRLGDGSLASRKAGSARGGEQLCLNVPRWISG